jgi:hypothetical protein
VQACKSPVKYLPIDEFKTQSIHFINSHPKADWDGQSDIAVIKKLSSKRNVALYFKFPSQNMPFVVFRMIILFFCSLLTTYFAAGIKKHKLFIVTTLIMVIIALFYGYHAFIANGFDDPMLDIVPMAIGLGFGILSNKKINS